MDLELFNPHLVGVIELGLPRREVEYAIQTSPGDEQDESSKILYVPLDLTDHTTQNVLSDKSTWKSDGLAAFATAIRYWETKRQSTNSSKTRLK